MKKMLNLFAVVIMTASFACQKEPITHPKPPAPLPPVHAKILIKFSELPEGVQIFYVEDLCLCEKDKDSILTEVNPASVTYPEYIWDVDTAFVRRYQNKEIDLYLFGIMGISPYMGEGLRKRFTFTLKPDPDINTFFIEIKRWEGGKK